jgi:hypothetical protein
MARRRGKTRVPKIPSPEWKRPIGFAADGELMTLRDAQARSKPLVDFSELSASQQAELVARRIELRKEIKLFMIGAGMIDKARALVEVRSQSKIGQTLIEIEQLVISDLLRRVQVD